MRPISGNRMCKVLERRGWVHDRSDGSHKVYVHDDSPFSIAVPVHANRDLPIGTQKTIMRQAGLTEADL